MSPNCTFLCGSPLRTEQMEDLNIKIEYDWKLHQRLNSPWHASDRPCRLCSLGHRKPGASRHSIVRESAPAAGRAVQASARRAGCVVLMRYTLTFTMPLGVRKILAWLRENPCTEISFAKFPSRCGAPVPSGAPTADTATRRKQGWGEGSVEGVRSQRTAFPPLFLSVMGESADHPLGLLCTCWALCSRQQAAPSACRRLSDS